MIGISHRVSPAALGMIFAVSLIFSACTPSPLYRDNRRATTTAPVPEPPRETYRESGEYISGFASYYGPNFVGRPTANGEIFDPRQMTAAHKTLPFNTLLKVTLVSTGKSVIVRINDRGPFVNDRILDLSEGAAEKIGLKQMGVGYINAQILTQDGE
ncbi:MAG TPA: septal ring lytic transglycosylase RlpA family protein [Bacteroidetes bacterium]|nr:RlpA-like protein precursor [bacterium BMS3Bbin04]HDO64613.1 septal ring lytic transglycosylase RlpA family protein [Bacteroidota bacterium]HEX03738.1 septal ring lytic transglycosylase RlpA family protein [Bacteroidota bacterium]